jgi:hypothetical protein
VSDDILDLRYDQLRDERFDDYEPANDYEDQMDGVRLGLYDHDDVHCKHGTFVGGWAGPDYMCGYCEDGITDEDYAEMLAERRVHDAKVRAAKERWAELNAAIESKGKDAWPEAEAFLKSEEGKWLFR